MLPSAIAAQRLDNQYLAGEKFQSPAQVVSWLGAVQAQEYALAKWALGLRMVETTEALIEEAFNNGEILRTHLMRPTWHFVIPADIRWLLDLTAPRVHQVNGTMYRKLELDEDLLCRSVDLIANALAGGKHLTRAELAAVLMENGIDTTDGMRMGYIVHYAELEGVVCSGVRRGKQHTYALIAERAPYARQLSRDEALAELTLRFFTSHGPATVKDFAWWSGLTLTDVRAGLASLGIQIMHEVIDGETYWFPVSSSQPKEFPGEGYLLPIYDEYTIAYKGQSAYAFLSPAYERLITDRFFTSAFVYKGEIIGMWRRTLRSTVSKKEVVVELQPFRPFSTNEQDAFQTASRRFARFLEMQVDFG
ncbi:MAG: winged helix DNA-binding domain-containing protein [bacterium]|nr:winged helix DNA-binding domain-containing protein [bacterium]